MSLWSTYYQEISIDGRPDFQQVLKDKKAIIPDENGHQWMLNPDVLGRRGQVGSQRISGYVLGSGPDSLDFFGYNKQDEDGFDVQEFLAKKISEYFPGEILHLYSSYSTCGLSRNIAFDDYYKDGQHTDCQGVPCLQSLNIPANWVEDFDENRVKIAFEVKREREIDEGTVSVQIQTCAAVIEKQDICKRNEDDINDYILCARTNSMDAQLLDTEHNMELVEEFVPIDVFLLACQDGLSYLREQRHAEEAAFLMSLDEEDSTEA